MAETAFRKVDVDALDEDVLLPADLYDPDPRGPAAVLSAAKQKSNDARGAVSKGDITGALTTILSDPPFGEGVDEAKSMTTATVLTILNSTRAADIPNVLKSLGPEQQDHLMAYLYKGMGALSAGGEVSGSVLLTWHEKLTEVAGVGCIVRVMTDRRLL